MKSRLYDKLSKCCTEDEVRSEFARYFKFKLNTKQRIDHLTDQILYEFKYDKNLKNIKVKSRTIAQTLYYIRKLKYGKTSKPIPRNICIVDNDEAFVFSTVSYKSFYTANKKYDWDRAASHLVLF